MDCSPIETTKKLVFISKLIQDKRDLKLKKKEKKETIKRKQKKEKKKVKKRKNKGWKSLQLCKFYSFHQKLPNI